MGIVSVTPHPSRYANKGLWDDEQPLQDELTVQYEPTVGRFHLRFDTIKQGRTRSLRAKRQREVADVLSAALGEKPVYQRSEKHYTIGDWLVFASDMDEKVRVSTGQFAMEDADQIVSALDALRLAGYVPDGDIQISFTPEAYDLKLVKNVLNIIEARSALLAQALGLPEEIKIILDETLTFGIPMEAFSAEKVEACIHLLGQVSRMAAELGKARMKPCDGSNPKYQMRTWLLRLGFIGDAFARSRQTLLSGLSGDGAFFSEAGKAKAAQKRRAKGTDIGQAS